MQVWRPRKGPFLWLHSSFVRVRLSEKEFGSVFPKQTRGKKGENVSARAFRGARNGLGCCYTALNFLLLVYLKLRAIEPRAFKHYRTVIYWPDTECRMLKDKMNTNRKLE